MIRMKTAVSGNGFSVGANQTCDHFTKEEEKRFVESGLAEYVNPKPNKKAKKKTR